MSGAALLVPPAELVEVVPRLLGVWLADSLVVLGFRDRDLVCAARGDLPQTDPMRLEEVAEGYLARVQRHHATAVAVLGYGPAVRVGPVVAGLGHEAERRGLGIAEMLRIYGGRWWSYLCQEPACCPPEGTAFIPAQVRP